MPRSSLRGGASRRPLAVIGALAVVVLAIGAASRLGVHGGGPPAAAQPVQAAELVVQDRDDGGVAVLRAGDRTVVDVLPPGTNGFLRVVLAGLVRERRREDMGAPSLPFRLTRWSDGRLTIDDDATGKLIELNAFGPDNAGAFARLLELSHPHSPPPLAR